MKNRPLKHKKENAFQFKTFSERIAEVDIRRSALYHVGHENEALEENQSYFHQTIQKWSALNLTEEYRLFQAPLRNIVTLPQLLHKKTFIMDHLLRCLHNATNLSLQPILEFVVVLAKDLREEFSPYFMDIFDKLIDHLDTKDTDKLEWTLLCLAFLFKNQRGFLRKRMDAIFERITKLLDERKPLHVNIFAAECFSFIARDVKNKRELLLMIASAAEKTPTTVTGSGRLMFEIMRGVNGQFHSCARQFWKILFEEITRRNAEFSQTVLFEILVQTVTDMVQCITSSNLQPFWESTYECISSLLANQEASDSDEKALHRTLKIAGIVVEHNRGKGIDNVTLIGLLVKIINRARSEETLSSVTKIVVIMMLSKHVQITQLEASRLAKNIMRVGPAFRETFEEFVLNAVDYSMFESLILPDYLNYFENCFNPASLQLLSQLVTRKAPLEMHGMNLCEWKQFPIRLKTARIKKQIFQLLQERPDSDTEFQLCLILLPHLVDFDCDESVSQLLEKRVKMLLTSLADKFDINQCFVLCLLTHSMVHLSKITPTMFVQIVTEIVPLVSTTNQESLIKIINLCLAKLEQDEQSLLSGNLFDAVHRHLRDFLSSPHHETRLLVAHTFTLFRHLSKLQVQDEPQILFEIIHDIEVVEPTIQTYREQIMLLKKLEFDATFMQNMSHECDFRLDAMRFVLSLFSVNFKLLWEPTVEVLQSYADEFAVEDFWKLYKRQLDLVLENANSNKVTKSEMDEDLDSSDTLPALQSIKLRFWDSSDKTDYVNYRVQLLLTLSKFNKIFEAKNRDIVDSFFKFIQDEYRVRQSGSNRREEAPDQLPKATQKILLAYLSMFARMRNPKTVYKSNQLYEIYLELVSHACFEVKKLALDCIFTYNNNAIVPYKEHLYRFNSDQTVKQAMQTLFEEDSSNAAGFRCVILDEHRAQAVPLLMKILHTKMTQKSTPSELKDSLLRFIANFREEEINLFVSMSFSYFENMLQTDPLQTIRRISTSGASLGEDLSVQRLNALVNLIDSILKDLAGSKDLAFTRRLLHLKLCMDCTLQHMDHSMVKQLKARTLSSLVEFFEHFETYQWTPAEIEAVFRIYVWPQLGKFESDCLHSPTPLLKLFVSWSNNPRHHALLARCATDPGVCESSSPLAHTINLLCAEKANESIVKEICKMITNLLTLEAPNSTDENNRTAHEQLSQGASLLVPFFSRILSYLERTIMRRRSVSKDLLYILSKLAVHAKTGEACESLVGMLLQITIKKVTLQHLEVDIIHDLHATVLSLMEQLDHPEKYLRQLGTLLERVRDAAIRKMICQMISLMAEKSNNAAHVQCAQLVCDMNRMDTRWLDQPDYECRLGAFRALERQISDGSNEISTDLAILMAHQCFYYLSTEKDLAVRDNASQCLRKLTVATVRQPGASSDADVHYFVERIMLNALMKGIKDKNGATRNESIQLLGDLSRECSSYGGVFADLHSFTSSQDREVDFFDNITHLQLHRHRRAMNRFCKVAANLTSLPSTRTLVYFLLPTVSTYLCNEKYRKKVKLTEAAGNCVVMIARMLPWSSYKVLLKHYVNRMKQSLEYQKQLIKLVVGLLDNFHYDLSRADTEDLGDTSEIKDEEEEQGNGTPTDSESNEDDDELENVKHDEPSLESNVISFKGQTVLCKETATAVTKDITLQLIPDLLCAFNFREMPAGIKLNERKERYNREKNEMLKIPIAIAITKLLQKLPPRFMDLTLSKLLIKVMNFLKSNLKQVRGMARETLKNMLQTVGPTYLRMTLENLASILKRGFQVHVLVVTVHTLLDALKGQLTPAVVDDVLNIVLDMCINDIFGLLSEEKGISSVTSKTPEAKPSKKSFLSLQILAQNMSEQSTLGIILPFKEIIAKATSRKVIANIDEALSKISEGICANPGICVKSILMFVYGITSDSIPDLTYDEAGKMSASKRKDKREVPNTYLIAAEPKRKGTFNQVASRTNSKTNAHLFVEMGLEILLILIKRNQVLSLDYESFLDPLVPILIDSMNSIYTKMTVLSIKCICSIWSSKLELSSVKSNIATIVDNTLGILHKYATAVISRADENFQLVKGSFRAMVALLKFVKYFTISNEQLNTLLLYVEQDLYNPEKSTMALILLRSIVGAKLVAPEMAVIMKKVSEQSIINESLRTREECRLIVLEYMMNYPLGSNVDHTIQFFISQLEYEELFGRESAVFMLHAIVKSFPLNVLNQRASLFFLAVGIRLVNEESPECRKSVAECIECLLSRLDKPHRDQLFDLTLEIFQNNRGNHRELAAQLAIRLMNVERNSFDARVGKLFPILLATVSNVESNGAGRFVKLKPAETDNGNNAKDQKAKDHALIQALNALCALFEACPEALECGEFDGQVDELAYNLQTLLSHAHQWVRCKALELLGKILHTVNVETVHAIMRGDPVQRDRKFIYSNPTAELKSLVLDLCTQLIPTETEEDVMILITENLLIIANLLKAVQLQVNAERHSDGSADDAKSINLLWLVRRIRYVIQSEVSKAPTSIVLRKHLFQWMVAVVELLDQETTLILAPSMLAPVVRETSDEDHLSEDLKEIVLILSRAIKAKIGVERFDKIHLRVLSSVQAKRVARQRAFATEKINNPVLAAKRKTTDRIRKSRTKKRKVEKNNIIGKQRHTAGKKRRKLEDLFQ